MEEFLLGGFLAGDKLDIIHQEQIRFPVFGAEFDVFTVFDGINQLVCKLVSFDIDNVGIGIFLPDAVGDGIQKVGFSHAGRAVDKQWIVNLSRRFAHRNGSRMGEAVGGSHHEIVKGKLGIEIHGGGGVSFGFPGVQFLIPKNEQFCVGIKNFLQGILNIIGAATADDLSAKIRGRIENQIVFIQFHYLGIIEPGGNGNGTQPFLHIA